jgi:hypothetical protein
MDGRLRPMSYRDFTIQDVKQKLGLRLEEDESLYDAVEDVAPSPALAAWLDENAQLALGINTEKARSELIIAPVLLEVRRLVGKPIGFFSGRELNVDPARGLVGVCDFLLSLSPERYVVTAPLFVVTEAKNEDMPSGLPQCLAAMVAAYEFNAKNGVILPAVHGVVTTGSSWRFLRLIGADAWIDRQEYYLHDLGRILGVLCRVVREVREAVPAPR